MGVVNIKFKHLQYLDNRVVIVYKWETNLQCTAGEHVRFKSSVRLTLAWVCCSSCSILSLSSLRLLFVSNRMLIVSVFFISSSCWARVFAVTWNRIKCKIKKIRRRSARSVQPQTRSYWVNEYTNKPASSLEQRSNCPAPPSALVPNAPPSNGNAKSPLGRPQNETLRSPSPDVQTCDEQCGSTVLRNSEIMTVQEHPAVWAR